MVEQIDGFGFSPPNSNQYYAVDSDENIAIYNNQSNTLQINILDAIQATLINYNVTIRQHSSPASDSAVILVTLKYNNEIITSYQNNIPNVGDTTLIDNTFPSYLTRLNKGDKLQMIVAVSGAGAGAVFFNMSLGVGGQYIS